MSGKFKFENCRNLIVILRYGEATAPAHKRMSSAAPANVRSLTSHFGGMSLNKENDVPAKVKKKNI